MEYSGCGGCLLCSSGIKSTIALHQSGRLTMNKIRTTTMIPQPGKPWGIHVYVEALRWNRDHPSEQQLPTASVRPAALDHAFMYLFDEVRGITGDLITPPKGSFPGTPGVQMAIMTDRPFQVSWREEFN